MKMNMKRTPIPYYGGKTRLAHRIVSLIPRHTTYVEPFFGGGAVFFAKPVPEIAPSKYREVVNDQNDLLINFYRTYRDHPKKLLAKIDKTLYSVAELAEAHAVLRDRTADPVTLAWAVFVSLSMSYMARMDTSFRRGIVGTNYPSIFQNKTKLLHHFEGRLKNAYIECEDALSVIDRWDTPDTFFYLDPPYPGYDQGHYKGYSQQDFEALIRKLKRIKGSFILSHYHNDAIPQTWERHRFKNHCHGRTQAHTTEFLFRKVRRSGFSPAARKVFKSGELDCFAA